MVYIQNLLESRNKNYYTIFISLEWTKLGLSPRISQIFTYLSADDVTRHPFIWLLSCSPGGWRVQQCESNSNPHFTETRIHFEVKTWEQPQYSPHAKLHSRTKEQNINGSSMLPLVPVVRAKGTMQACFASQSPQQRFASHASYHN